MKISVLQKPKNVWEVLFESAIVEKYVHKAEFGKKIKRELITQKGLRKLKK